jgi:hypothetical protein
MTHTPAPWSCKNRPHGIYVETATGALVADCFVLSVPMSECHANAHLIAAAPEMLNALRLAKRAINELSAAIPNDDGLADLVSQLQTAEDAEAAIDAILAKAAA